MKMKSLLRRLPPPFIARLLYLRDLSRTVTRSRGLIDRECNICGYKGRFLGFGSPLRYDAICPRCCAAERHRLLLMYLQQRSTEIEGKHVLHFAPEYAIKNFVVQYCASYTGADIVSRPDCVTLDIEKVQQANESFDVIFCSHVLEHVDDTKALDEMHRILRPGGTAFLMSPIIEGWDETYENAEIDSADGREVHFGQHDHVRYFGHDLRDRIRAADFLLEEFTATEPAVTRFGLARGEKVFIARKPLAGGA